jgi:hypothetical protein
MPTDSRYSVQAARRAAERGELGDWVAEFLASAGSDNEVLAAKLSEPTRYWLGPVGLPIDRLHRFAGPAGHPVLRVTEEEEWRDDVEQMTELVEHGSHLPPIVVTYRSGVLLVEDGNHRVESLRRAGASEAWAVVGFDSAEDRDRFRQSEM